MKRAIFYLSILLLVQFGLVFALHREDQNTLIGKSPGKLLNFAVEQVDEMDFRGAGDTHLTLKKTADGWIIPDHFAATADAGKVGELMSTLGGLTRPWPVARTAETGKRFKVDDQGFERKLDFRSQGKILGTLLLGSSPGFRKVHVRLSGEKQIYDIPFSTFQASLKPEDWIDQNQLQVKADTVSAVELPDCQLTRQNGKLQVESLPETEQTNVGQAQALLETLANVRILDIAGEVGRQPSHPPELQIKLGLNNGTSRDYTWFKGGQDGDALLQVSGSPSLFKVSSSLLDGLKAFNRAELVQPRAVATPAGLENGKPAGAEKQG